MVVVVKVRNCNHRHRHRLSKHGEVPPVHARVMSPRHYTWPRPQQHYEGHLGSPAATYGEAFRVPGYAIYTEGVSRMCYHPTHAGKCGLPLHGGHSSSLSITSPSMVLLPHANQKIHLISRVCDPLQLEHTSTTMNLLTIDVLPEQPQVFKPCPPGVWPTTSIVGPPEREKYRSLNHPGLLSGIYIEVL